MYQPAYIHPLGLDGLHRPAAAPEMRCKTDSRDVAARGRILLCTRWVGRWVWVVPNNVCCWSFRGGGPGWKKDTRRVKWCCSKIIFQMIINISCLKLFMAGKYLNYPCRHSTLHFGGVGAGLFQLLYAMAVVGWWVAGWLTGTCII